MEILSDSDDYQTVVDKMSKKDFDELLLDISETVEIEADKEFMLAVANRKQKESNS